MKSINVGLIGFGVAGRVFHAPMITSLPGLKLRKIRETKSENIEIAHQRYPEAEIVNDSSTIFQDESIDLVVIATPNVTHFPLAQQALKAGKHVVVDKPFTVTTEEADSLIELAKAQNKVISVYHNRRFDSTSKTVRKILESKILGDLVEYEAHYDRFRNYFRPNAWREENIPGSGIFYDLGAHLIDDVQSLFGLPHEITGDLRIQRPGGKTIDQFEVVLHYNKLKVTLKGGMLVRESGPAISLYGLSGSYVKYGMDVQEEALRSGEIPNTNINWGKEPEILWGKINTDINGLHITGTVESERGDYREFYANIYQVLTASEELIVKPEQARNTIRIIELATQSSIEKKTLKVEKM